MSFIEILLPFAAGFIISLIATPIMMIVAKYTGMVDQPSARRFHTNPTPLLGGMAVFLSFAAIIILFGGMPLIIKYKIMLLASLAAVVLGVFDDVKTLNPMLKLAGQFFLGLALYSKGIKIDVFDSELSNLALLLFWTIGIINALNFVDNINGLSGGLTAIICGFFGYIFYMHNQFFPSLFAVAVTGSSLGFLFYNYRKEAKIFLGDAGSMFFGYSIAALGLLVSKLHPTQPAFYVSPITIAGVLIFDMFLVVIFRTSNKRKIYDGGKDHTSHRLVNLGLSEMLAVFVLFVMSIILGFLGVIILNFNTMNAIITLVVLAFIGLIFGLIIKKGYKYSFSDE